MHTNLNILLETQSLKERLMHIGANSKQAIFTTSLSHEDQIITHLIALNALPIEIVTLDTGRLFDETIALIKQTEEKYNITIKRLIPVQDEVSQYVEKNGLNGFYESIELRKQCCFIRKLAPLEHALSQADGWVTGLRRSQSDHRCDIPFYQWDEGYKIHKFNPLADMDSKSVLEFVLTHNIPSNPLYQKGYASIGCAPCTRAIKTGEPERAGRWWWENEEQQECGLHVSHNIVKKVI